MDRGRQPFYAPAVSQALSASWLSTKWGVDTVKINAMRRAGELLAVRPAGSLEWRFPAWQFGPDGQVRPEVARVLAAARERGLRSEQVYALLERRSGMTGGDRLRDDLLDGRVDHVIAALATA
jgi:hypothetical protein